MYRKPLILPRDYEGSLWCNNLYHLDGARQLITHMSHNPEIDVNFPTSSYSKYTTAIKPLIDLLIRQIKALHSWPYHIPTY
jgi:hypothetical protein